MNMKWPNVVFQEVWPLLVGAYVMRIAWRLGRDLDTLLWPFKPLLRLVGFLIFRLFPYNLFLCFGVFMLFFVIYPRPDHMVTVTVNQCPRWTIHGAQEHHTAEPQEEDATEEGEEATEAGEGTSQPQPGQERRQRPIVEQAEDALESLGLQGSSETRERQAIYEGDLAHIEDYPWTVAVGEEIGLNLFPWKRAKNKIPTTTCTGIVLSEHWVVTALHCRTTWMGRLWITAGTDCLPEHGGIHDSYAQIRYAVEEVPLLTQERVYEDVIVPDTEPDSPEPRPHGKYPQPALPHEYVRWLGWVYHKIRRWGGTHAVIKFEQWERHIQALFGVIIIKLRTPDYGPETRHNDLILLRLNEPLKLRPMREYKFGSVPYDKRSNVTSIVMALPIPGNFQSSAPQEDDEDKDKKSKKEDQKKKKEDQQKKKEDQQKKKEDQQKEKKEEKSDQAEGGPEKEEKSEPKQKEIIPKKEDIVPDSKKDELHVTGWGETRSPHLVEPPLRLRRGIITHWKFTPQRVPSTELLDAPCSNPDSGYFCVERPNPLAWLYQTCRGDAGGPWVLMRAKSRSKPLLYAMTQGTVGSSQPLACGDADLMIAVKLLYQRAEIEKATQRSFWDPRDM